MFSSPIYHATLVNYRCTGGFTYFALHFIHATFCIEPRTLFHLYNPTDIISMISADSFKVYLTGGATWDMMIDNDYSKNKTLLPDFGLGVIQKASYRVVPFSKSKDTREIKRVIIEDQQVKN